MYTYSFICPEIKANYVYQTSKSLSAAAECLPILYPESSMAFQIFLCTHTTPAASFADNARDKPRIFVNIITNGTPDNVKHFLHKQHY